MPDDLRALRSGKCEIRESVAEDFFRTDYRALMIYRPNYTGDTPIQAIVYTVVLKIVNREPHCPAEFPWRSACNRRCIEIQ
ncbi:MAG TPA: hypothetical protein DEB39_10175 [Planctomycetaceae bacterium]|nr:hypothetical protein [Planctomycetaceae bacterium]